MVEERPRRRLAAILAADVAGYSRLIELHEARTLAALKERRRTILVPLVASHHGRLVKVMGDGVIVEFGSAVNAVACAIALQTQMAFANDTIAADGHILLRVGVSLGDVVVEGNDLYGDGVNLAARLQVIAEPGAICISGTVHDQVKRKIDVAFEDLGLRILKNMADAVQVYRVASEASIAPAAGTPQAQAPIGKESAPLTPPATPSIAILPFTNMSNDPEHEFFADGLTEDLITDLSQVRGLFVIARNSTFAYKGKQVDVRSIARNLGVRYVLEGSARRASSRVRINVQLIDAEAGGHLWAERFDRSLDDVFQVQDEVTAKIVEALIGRLTTSQMPDRKRPANLEAYDLCVRGRSLVLRSPDMEREARSLFERAIALDPDYAEAYRWLAFTIDTTWLLAGVPVDPGRPLALEMAEKALALDPNNADTRWTYASILTSQRRWEDAETEFGVALKLDPNNADAWAMLSELMILVGRVADALSTVEKAIRLNPHPPGWYYWFLGQAQYLDRQFEQAATTLRREETYRTPSRRTLAASLAQLGRIEEARREADMFMASSPHFTISEWAATQPFKDDAARHHFVDGYRKAGLPD